MQVGDGDIIAPDHDQIGVLRLLGRHAGRVAIKALVGEAAHPTAERAPVHPGGPEAIEKPPIQRAAGQFAMRAGVVQRQDGLRAMGVDCGAKARHHQVQRRIPADALKLI